jgi:ABC-type nitrate/sulfonate/bicarbonate transport system ATPase subunit
MKIRSPTLGEVSIDGKCVTKAGPERGMVFQHYTLYPWMSVQQNGGDAKTWTGGDRCCLTGMSR